MNRVVTRTRTRVEHLTLDRAQCHELRNDGLRAADVPRGGGRQSVRRPLVSVQLFEAIWIYGSSHARENRPVNLVRRSTWNSRRSDGDSSPLRGSAPADSSP